MARRIFISYSRNDKGNLPPLVKGLERLHHSLWLDEQLEGGQQWWDEVLTQLRACDVLVIGVSEAMLDSDACKAELRYAQALGKPVLPVVIDRVNTDLLPSALAPLQLVDFTPANPSAPYDLIAALDRLPAPPPLPDPLPEPPAVPISYLSGLGELVRERSLTLDQQLVLVQKLRAGLYRARDREGAIELMRGMRERDDLYVSTSRALEEAFDEATRTSGPAAPSAADSSTGATAQPAPVAPPAGAPADAPTNAQTNAPAAFAAPAHAVPSGTPSPTVPAPPRGGRGRKRVLIGVAVALLLATGAGIAASLAGRTTGGGDGSDGGGSGANSVGAVAVGDSCVVGSWRSTAVTLPDGSGTASGGEGLGLTITADGAATYDFSSMQPLEGTDGSDQMKVEFTGRLETRLQARSGTTTETVVSDTVSFQTYRNGEAEGTPTTGAADFADSKPYSCTDTTLTLGDSTDSVTFERQ